VAQRIASDARIVYVDNDPLVLVHARALLNSRPEGKTAYVDADMRDPDRILDQARHTLDFRQPIALMLVAVLHFLSDADQAHSLVQRLSAELVPGSLLVLSHFSYDLVPPDNVNSLTREKYPGNEDFYPRTRDDITRFFAGWEPLKTPEAGQQGGAAAACLISEWGPEFREPGEVIPDPSDVSMFGGVALKPA
jgi:S-adenosyl methyltransferase